MRRVLGWVLLGLVTGSALTADVSILERKAMRQKSGKLKHGGHAGGATGSIGLIDSQGLKYFINTDITFSTSSSASAAMSEASYTHAVAASTSAGGTTAETLNDAFDGYNALCVSLNHTVAACETGNANFSFYNKNGPPTTECPGPVSHTNRQVVFPAEELAGFGGNLQVSRKVFVPDNDEFGRWLNYFTNTGGSPLTVTMVTSNNLGSDAKTKIVATSTGLTTVDVTDTWVTTFQDFTGNTTTDPRLGHVLQGAGAAVPLAGIFFANGNDRPYWGYTFNLNPGETKIIANFVTGQPSRAAANAKAAQLVGLPTNALQCLSTAERSEIANFNAAVAIAQVPTLSQGALTALVLLLCLAALIRLRTRAEVRRR